MNKFQRLSEKRNYSSLQWHRMHECELSFASHFHEGKCLLVTAIYSHEKQFIVSCVSERECVCPVCLEPVLVSVWKTIHMPHSIYLCFSLCLLSLVSSFNEYKWPVVTSGIYFSLSLSLLLSCLDLRLPRSLVYNEVTCTRINVSKWMRSNDTNNTRRDSTRARKTWTHAHAQRKK